MTKLTALGTLGALLFTATVAASGPATALAANPASRCCRSGSHTHSSYGGYYYVRPHYQRGYTTRTGRYVPGHYVAGHYTRTLRRYAPLYRVRRPVVPIYPSSCYLLPTPTPTATSGGRA